MSSQTAIMGFGNPCRSDDAVGVYVIDELKKKLGVKEHVSLLDMGTGAFELLFKLKGHDKIILIDAVLNSGETDGTVFKVPAAEIASAPIEDPLVFLHSIKWDQALSYAKKILQNDYPHDITVYLIAITDTKLEMQMSNPVKEGGTRVVKKIMEDITAMYN